MLGVVSFHTAMATCFSTGRGVCGLPFKGGCQLGADFYEGGPRHVEINLLLLVVPGSQDDELLLFVAHLP